jgi:hypothetical protein
MPEEGPESSTAVFITKYQLFSASHYEIRTATILENLSEENFSSKGILVHASLTPSPSLKVYSSKNFRQIQLWEFFSARFLPTFMTSCDIFSTV